MVVVMYRITWIAVGCWLLCSILAVQADEHPDLPPSHSVKPELYATGFEFAEGPAFDAAGNLFVVNYGRLGTIGRITPDRAASIFCDLRKSAPPVKGRSAQANGLKVDRQGWLIVADAGAGRVLRIKETDSRTSPTPSPTVLVHRFDDKPLDAPNDVALDLAGNIYFSDPGQSNAKQPTGSVYRYDVHTYKLVRLDTALAYPNGLAVTPDQKQLCLAESERHRVLIYDLDSAGRVSNRRVLIDFMEKSEGNLTGEKIVPDGMIFDAVGRLYVATWTGGVINVVDVPSGKLLRQYDAGGQQATNCHFHGGYLYTTVAAKKAVFRLKLGVEGFDYRK
jgi:gluconolactonase